MKKKRRKLNLIITLTIIFLLIITIIVYFLIQNNNIKQQSIRAPVFAGSWYPADKEELQNLTQSYLNNSRKINFNGRIRAIIVPHAGYVYSGQVAATAFKQLDEKNNYETIFLLGPSHRYYLTNVSVSNFSYFSTPLGKVKVSKKAKQMDDEEDIISNIEDAQSNEHALEVELPFLQTQLNDSQFEIVPLIVGETDTDKLKNALVKFLGENDLIVVSADLSHYHEYNQALALDSYTINNIINLNSEEILNSEIDAPWAVASLLKIAKEKFWKPYLVTYANSGDITGNKTSVVGYSAIVFVEESNFSSADKKFLLNLARENAETYLKTGKKSEINEKNIPENLKIKKACFVTFTEDNQLRGCIGYILPQNPLYECVIENSINAATKDTRFSPVNYSEMKNIKIDISVLTVPVLLEHNSSQDLLSKLNSSKDGVILKRGEYQSTFLPSVWEFIPDEQQFLANLCIKGNMEAECWKDTKTQVYVYTAEDFSE